MKKQIKILLIVILSFGIIGVFALEFICELGIKCENCTRTSISINESKENGFYLMDYQPIDNTLRLKQHEETIEFMTVWVENQWYTNSDICLLRYKEKRAGYNIVFEFKKSNKNTFLFSLSPIIDGNPDETNGGILEDRKEIRLSNLTDTIWLQVYEKNPQINVGWKDKIEGQKIGFIKK